MYATVFNTTDSPLVVDAEGRIIGGGDWGTVDTTADEAKVALDDDRLVIVEERKDHPAAEVFARTAVVRKSADALAKLDKDRLTALAEDNGVDPDQHKPELVRALAARGVTPTKES